MNITKHRFFGHAVLALLLIIVIGLQSEGIQGATGKTVSLPVGEAGNEIKLTAPDIVAGAQFGASLTVYGDRAVAGAPKDNGNAPNSGAAYILARGEESWSVGSKLAASDGATNDNFGGAVAIDGDLLVVGAHGDDDAGANAGAAYVFRNDGATWVEEKKLTPSNVGDTFFGYAVAIRGKTIVVGAPYSGSGVSNVGSVYIFEETDAGWVEIKRLTSGLSGGAVLSDLFGWSVGISGNTIVVGAYLDERAYLYAEGPSGWEALPPLRGNDTQGGHRFGWSVAIEGATIVVGAPQESSNGISAGAVYVFTFNAGNWGQAAKLTHSDAHPGSRFGWSVDVHESMVLVGARESKGMSDLEESGAAYLFQRDNTVWNELHILNASDGADGDHYGAAVAVGASAALVGAPDHNAGEPTAGAVYLYPLPVAPGPTPDPSETPTDEPGPEPSETPTDEPSETPTDEPTPDPQPSETPTDEPTPDPKPSETPTIPPPTVPAPISTNCEEMTATEQTTEVVLPGVTLRWDSAFHCREAETAGAYGFTVTVRNEGVGAAAGADEDTVVITDLALTHTTPRPEGQSPSANVTVAGLPLTLPAGEQGELLVSGNYELVQAGAMQLANLHFCTSGASESGDTFALGLNAHLRGSVPPLGASDILPPPAISAIEVIPGLGRLTIRWRTDQPTMGRIRVQAGSGDGAVHIYSTGCARGQEHTIVIENLGVDIEYVVQIHSTNDDGVATTSEAVRVSTTASEGNLRTYLPAVLR
ncbi:MAG: hypothetical protein KJZ93_02610 [Caldilineaceae bacterium]|nr:hypothetical protein [Caldilineaceae bacterium]